MSETEEKNAEKPSRPPLMIGTPTLLIRLHRWLHSTPVEGCDGCAQVAKMRADKNLKKKET